ncbi:class V chitinase-like [Humulus lupulus]|uniref:class V chitinase-like n=1 Tax=Humulus lupulus TaxID=3486 RepID=UPI002B40C63D|nr:class V chitinase-like [Humulus lupulus]
MASKTKTSPLLLFFVLCFLFNLRLSAAQTVVKGSYWFYGTEFEVSNINSSLFTHLFCAFADLNSTTYRVTIPNSVSTQFSTFTTTVQRKNPSVKTLLSIGGGGASASVFAAMASQPSRRNSFIDSSIKLARSYNFHGLDLDWEYPSTATEIANFGKLLLEWKAAVANESRTSGKSQLHLSAAVFRAPNYYSLDLPVRNISNSLDWINVMSYDFYGPGWSPNYTAPPSGLYNATASQANGAAGIRNWIQAEFPARKIVFGMPFYGYAWRLVNANNNGLFSPANGAALSTSGDIGYNGIRSFISSNGARCVYNATVVSDYCYSGTTWIGYDDVKSVSTKVAYAKSQGLLGYFSWNVGSDYNWTLSQTAFSTWGA